jgi:hypothetical protein
MHSKTRTIPIAAAAIVTVFAGTAAYAQSLDPDCNAARPPAVGPGMDSGDTQPGVVPRDSLSDQLATCGSVLNPPAVGDPDVVQPAPAIDDPMTIHPQNPQLKKN